MKDRVTRQCRRDQLTSPSDIASGRIRDASDVARGRAACRPSLTRRQEHGRRNQCAAASTGGTCFGDSGSPNYLGTSSVVAGVTSFALNGSCGGTGGVFRLDKRDVLDFVKSFLR